MPFLFIGIPLASVIILNMLTWKSKMMAMHIALGVSVIQLGIGVFDIAWILRSGAPAVSTFFGALTVDLFSAIVLSIVGLVGLVTALCAGETVHESRFSFASALLLLIMGMNGVAMVTDVFSLYVFIEVSSAASFLLIAIDREKRGLEGAFKYYIMSALASTMMLIAIALLFLAVEDTTFAALADYFRGRAERPFYVTAAMLLFVIALSVKSGVVPFHTWVPDAHSSAPSPVSVVLAGAVIKVSGAYALMRVYTDVFLSDPRIGNVLMILSLVSIAVGALGAIGQTDIKRMLAFSSVSQVGYIILGVSTGSALGFVGAAAHFFNHATFKSLLFVNSAAIVHGTGTRDMDKLGGLGAKMPITSASSIIALLSMAGIPPLSGFWSKLLIVMAVWRVSMPAALAALCLSALTLGYFLVLQKKVFFGKLNPDLEGAHECGGSMRFVEVMLSAVNVGAGIAFPFLLVYLHARGML